MLYTVLKHIRNMFPVKQVTGKFNIVDGSISLSDAKENQYFLIEGSLFNDGVYKYPTTDLTDEEFEGAVTLMAIPKEFLDLVDEITSFTSANARTGIQSESFGGYSYTKASASGGQADWQDVFRQRLNVWRKI